MALVLAEQPELDVLDRRTVPETHERQPGSRPASKSSGDEMRRPGRLKLRRQPGNSQRSKKVSLSWLRSQ